MPPSSFVDHFLTHTSAYESPRSFWKWAAYTAVSAVLRDSCYRQMGDHRIYPNIYTLILADSAVHRKGHPVKLTEDLVKSVRNTKVISGRSSIQGILDELSRGETDKQSGKVLSGGSALFSASELSAGIVNDPEAVKILTDIYDFKEEYVSRLRGSGVFRIKNICFSLLAASNEELLRDVYDVKAIFGGLLGRTFLVKPNEFRPGNSLFEIRDTVASHKELCAKLARIAQLRGQYEITERARSAYDDWYLPFRKSYEGKSDRSGVAGRIHTSVLKLAMILAANNSLSLTIDECHICESIRECVALIPNYQGFVMSQGKSTVAECAAAFISALWERKDHRLAVSTFLQVHLHLYDADLVNKTLETLMKAELVRNVLNGDGAEHWEVTEKCREKFQLKETAAL